MALFNEKKYEQAIERLQESFSLNPNSNETAAYLKLAQLEHQRAEEAKLARIRTPQTATATPIAGPLGGRSAPEPVATSPSQLTTVFSHPFTEGRIIVRAGSDILANETLFVQKPSGIFRRLTPVPRPVAVTQSFPSKNADLEVWVTVPGQKIQEHHRIAGVRFEPGGNHRLVVSYNKTTKSFSYELN
jgi:hypothetical protein